MRSSVLKRVIESIRRRHRRSVSIRELSALDDRQLSDIGVVRGEIPRLVDELMSVREQGITQPLSVAQLARMQPEARAAANEARRRAA